MSAIFGIFCSCHVSIRNAVSFAIEGSVSGVINQVDITPCPSEPCQFKKGVNATMQVEFTPSRFHVYIFVNSHRKFAIFFKWQHTESNAYICPFII